MLVFYQYCISHTSRLVHVVACVRLAAYDLLGIRVLCLRDSESFPTSYNFLFDLLTLYFSSNVIYPLS
jgi:hypothetical protein